MEGKSNFFILLIIVAFLSLSLVVLAGYVFLVGGSSRNTQAETKQELTQRPDEKNLGRMELYDSKQVLNLKNTDDKKISVIQIGIELEYYFKDKTSKTVEDKLATNLAAMKEIVSNYFLDLTTDDVKLAETRMKAKEDLKKKFNELLTQNEKDKTDVVYEVFIYDWLFQ